MSRVKFPEQNCPRMTDRRARSVVALLTAFSMTARIGRDWVTGDRLFEALHIFADDAFYYLQIARHVIAGNGFTFDGVHATNGFHPLWQLVLLPVAALFPGDRAFMLAVIALQIAFATGAAVLVFANLRPAFGRIAAAGAVLLLVMEPGVTRVLVNGMESALLVLLLAVAWWAFRRWSAVPSSVGAAVVAGVALAFVFMARLEALVFTAVALGVAFPGRPPRACLVALALPTAVTGCALLAWWRLSFGVWLPMSGLVKTHWSAQRGLADNAIAALDLPWVGQWAIERIAGWSMTDGRCAVAHGLLLAALLGLATYKRRWLAARLALVDGTLPVLGGAVMIVLMKVLVPEFWAWQAVPVIFVVAVLGGAAWPERRPGMILLAGAVAFTLARDVRLLTGHPSPPRECSTAAVDAVRFVKERAAGGERVGSWNAGLIGYLAGGTVVNLDGLVNDADFLDRVVRTGNVQPYLQANGIRYVVDYRLGRYRAPGFEGAFGRLATFPPEGTSCPAALSVWNRR